MIFQFYKYQGTGNDFIIIDNRTNSIQLSTEEIAKLCDRRFGIGGDGLMLLQKHEQLDFEMVYFNSDGKTSSMCGNGGRCIVAFAKRIGHISDVTKFMAIDGEHEAKVSGDEVSLKMNDVNQIECRHDGSYYLNTGSPHFVKYVNEINEFDVFNEGKKVRYNDEFKEKGTNVNFIEQQSDVLYVRTYERGVEDETFSCGTGVTAAGLVASLSERGSNNCKIKTLGGELSVSYEGDLESGYKNIWLTGPATFVFKGKIETDGLL